MGLTWRHIDTMPLPKTRGGSKVLISACDGQLMMRIDVVGLQGRREN